MNSGRILQTLLLALLGFVAANAVSTTTKATETSQVVFAVNVNLGISDPAPTDFASFSVEVPCAPDMIMANKTTRTPRLSYINLMKHLRTVATGDPHMLDKSKKGPNLRIGGNSADETFFALRPDVPSFPGDNNRVTLSEILSYQHAEDWGGTVTVDISLRNETNVGNAVDYAAAATQILSADVIDGIEIGNEPSLFPGNGIRPHNQPWTYQDYLALFSKTLTGLEAAGIAGPEANHPLIQGGVFCCWHWNDDIAGYIANFTANNSSNSNVLKSFSYHYYPLSGRELTIEKLLAPSSVDVWPFKSYAAFAKSRGVKFVIGEGNSGSDGGREGVSNTLTSAVWAMDIMMHSLAFGIRRWNFHGCPSGAYTPIELDYETWPELYARPRPLYYGMWAFSMATSDGARLVEARHTSGDLAGNSSFYATVSKSHIGVVGLHKDPNPATAAPLVIKADFSVDCPFQRGAVGTIHRQHSVVNPKNWSVTNGLSFGGLTFDGSNTGTPVGTPTNETVNVDPTDCSVTFSVQPATAVVVLFPKS